MSIQELEVRLRALGDEGEKILKAATDEKRKLTDEEDARLKEIDAEVAEAGADVADIRKRAEARKRIEEARASEDWLVGARSFSSPDKPLEDRRTYSAWPVEEADQFMNAVRGYSQPGGALPKDMNVDLRDTFIDAIEKRAPTGQGTLIDSEGGFLVPESIAARVLQKVNSEGNLLKGTQDVPITVGNSTKFNAVKENARTSGNRYGGITVSRTGEAAAASGSKAEFERVSLEVKKLTALVYVTDEQLADGPQLLTVVNDLVPKAIVFKIEDELITGDGVTQMEGILNTNARVDVAKESGQALDTILFENIINMYSRMIASSRASAAWFINQDIEPQLFAMSLAVGTAGVPVYLPANGIAGSPFASLMGRPVIPIEHAKTLGDLGDIFFLDMGQYLYATKGGVKTAQSIHVKFIEGETAFRFVLRNDGKSWWPSALTPANGTNTLSPFIALAERA